MPATAPLLVVEDDNIVRMLMVDVLEELGYEVREAEDAEQALELGRQEYWKWLLMLSLIILGVEWYIYNRRIYI